MKISAILLILAIIGSGCYKEEGCDFYTYAAYSTSEGIWEVTNRSKWGYYSPENCEKLAQAKRDEMTGTYYWKGHEVSPEEIVFCSCKH
jgi:hypothetical protein